MADATIKPDSGNDLVLSNDDGSAKIEVNEGGDVEITPSTSLKVTLGSDSGDDFNVDSGKFLVKGDTGRIGIGTDNPTEADGQIANTFLRINNSSAVTCNLRITGSSAIRGANVGINSTTMYLDSTKCVP